ncbi:MAG: helix-turn-helix domain-containing protein [Chloroflexi bacterium]|nr:helix-turn-helix domain-containing protein [Chloroflexota bacterium]
MGRREKAVTSEPNTVASLGATLRRARQAKNISLTELAQRLGYSKSHLSVVETGRVWPSRELLQAYETALDLQSQSLVHLAETLAPLRRFRPSAPHVVPAVEQVLTRLARGVGIPAEGKGRRRRAGRLPANGASTRDPDLAVTWAEELVLAAAAATPPALRPEILVVTLTTPLLPGLEGERSGLTRALQQALQRGWSVSHVRWLDGAEEDRLAQYGRLLDFFGFRGEYRAFGLALAKGMGAPPYGLIVAPEHGALLLLPTRTDRLGQYAVYAAIFFSDAETVGVLWDNAVALRERAQPVVNAVSWPDDWLEAEVPDSAWLRVSDAATRAVVQPGERFLVKDGIGGLATPADLRWEREYLSRRGPAWETFLQALQADRILRQTAFREQMRLHQFRDVYTRRGLEQFLREGTNARDELWPASGFTKEQRVALLQSLIEALRTYQNYEVAILDGAPSWLTPTTSWLVKGGAVDGTVFLETFGQRDGKPIHLHLEVSDSIVVPAFRDYFLAFWEQIPPENRTKSTVIEELSSAVRRLESER